MTPDAESPGDSGNDQFTPDQLRGMAAAIGVALTPERAAALATQAGPHFAILRALDAIANPTTEPAAVFRLTPEDRA